MDKDLYDLEPEDLAKVPKAPGSLDEVLNALEKDHEFLLKGDVFTQDVIETWIDYKRTQGSRRDPPAAASVGVRAVLRHLRTDAVGIGVRGSASSPAPPEPRLLTFRRVPFPNSESRCHLSFGSLSLPRPHRGTRHVSTWAVRVPRRRRPPTSICRRWPRICRCARRWARWPDPLLEAFARAARSRRGARRLLALCRHACCRARCSCATWPDDPRALRRADRGAGQRRRS